MPISKSQTPPSVRTMDSLYKFIEALEEPKDDEVVYLNEEKPINLSFDEIKVGMLKVVRSF